DPDNQAALLRAYLDLKQRAGQLEAKLAEAEEQRKRQEAERQENERQAKAAAKRAQDEKAARLERLGQAMSLARWAAEWAEKGATFLAGARQNLGQVIDLATTGAEACERLRYDKDQNLWTFTWGGGRPDTVVGLYPSAGTAVPAAAATALARRRRPFAGSSPNQEPGSH
ncbi:MAG: hypothetical protein ACM3RP_06360, partial [Chitinophagales bacterium]